MRKVLTNIIVGKGPSRAKAKVGKVDNDERASSEPSSDSESDLEEQVRQRKEKQKVKINSFIAKADEWKECQKGSGGESEHEYDRVSLHAENELAGNLNNILGNSKESEDEDENQRMTLV